ncbi:hypothetical protein TNCV_4732211 [Trichonephila clavipes]|nr:hypothetical protein TNCV_4732211 [Trichonephila clavipes]
MTTSSPETFNNRLSLSRQNISYSNFCDLHYSNRTVFSNDSDVNLAYNLFTTEIPYEEVETEIISSNANNDEIYLISVPSMSGRAPLLFDTLLPKAMLGSIFTVSTIWGTTSKRTRNKLPTMFLTDTFVKNVLLF